MPEADTTRDYLRAEVESLEPLEFVAVAPSGKPLHVLEIGRDEDGKLQVVVPGRPRIAPEIPAPMRTALQDRGFASEDPADRTRPWVLATPTADSGIELAEKIHREVFGEEEGHAVDIFHGSHKREYEVRQKLGFVRERVARILTQLFEKQPDQDADGDFQLPIGDVQVTVAPRALPGGPMVVRIFAVTNVNVTVAPELGMFLARLNFSLMFGRFALDAEHNAIWFDETLLGEQFTDEELRFAVQVVGSTADEWDDRIKEMFGGSKYQEALAQKGGGAGLVKPGEGPGFYL